MATYKIRVLSAAICALTIGVQANVNAAEVAVEATTDKNAVAATEAATEKAVAGSEKTGDAKADAATNKDDAETKKADASDSKELKGGVSKTDAATPEALIDQLVQNAYDKDEKAMEIAKKEAKYSHPFHRSMARVTDMAQFMTSYKGFEASSEAADVILSEKQKLKSHAAVEWIKQKQRDDLHPRVVSSLMQIASGLGMSDPAKQQKNVDSGYEQLKSIVGEDEAKRALTAMTAWAATVRDTAPLSASQEPMSVLQLESASKKLLESSLQKDDVVLETKSKLHKYNHRSKIMMATAKVVNTTLSVAMFSPTIVSPAAQIALLAFLAATGGPEEAKLLKELYLDRRIESRYKMINAEAGQAINNYNVAAITGNTVLSQFCSLSAAKMGGKDVLAVSLGTIPDTGSGVTVTTSDAKADGTTSDAKTDATAAVDATTAVKTDSTDVKTEVTVSDKKAETEKNADAEKKAEAVTDTKTETSTEKKAEGTTTSTEVKTEASATATETSAAASTDADSIHTLATTSATPAMDILRKSGALSKTTVEATDKSAAKSAEAEGKSDKKTGDVGMNQPGTSL